MDGNTRTLRTHTHSKKYNIIIEWFERMNDEVKHKYTSWEHCGRQWLQAQTKCALDRTAIGKSTIRTTHRIQSTLGNGHIRYAMRRPSPFAFSGQKWIEADRSCIDERESSMRASSISAMAPNEKKRQRTQNVRRSVKERRWKKKKKIKWNKNCCLCTFFSRSHGWGWRPVILMEKRNWS